VTTPFLISYVALWILVIVEAIALFALYHHFGEMYLNSSEGRASQGPEVDSELKPSEVQSISGSKLRIPPVGKPSILLFASTECTLCDELRPGFKKFAETHPEFQTLLVCAGNPKAVFGWADGLSEVTEVVPDAGYRIAARYGIGMTPFLVGIGASGRVRTKGIVNSLQGLEVAAEQTVTLEEQARDRTLVGLEKKPK
jgi:thiol-disulfide isomerase/thioredoxin